MVSIAHARNHQFGNRMNLNKTLKTIAVTLLMMLSIISTVTAEDVRNYQVELVVFEHIYSNASPEGEVRTTEQDDYRNLVNFYNVAAEDLVLTDDAKRIRGSRNFRFLKHIAWAQEGLAKEDAGSINLARWLPNVEGSVTLYLARYLHLDISMEKQYEDDYRAILDEKRRMRSNETHYLDNPKLGIIARITPIE